MQYTVFELSDPREADIPRYVGWGASPTPWVALWQRGEPQVAVWFRSLREANLEPLARRLVGVSTIAGAEALSKLRIQQIAAWSGTAPKLPSWYLGSAWWERPAVPRLAAKGVIRRAQDGSQTRWRSIRQASIETGSHRDSISMWVRSGIVNTSGCVWSYDL